MTPCPGAARCLVSLVLAGLAAACTSALKDPPPVSLLAGRGPTSSVNRDVSVVLVEAEIEMARRPDVNAVERARQLYLQAIAGDGPPLEGFLGAARTTSWLVQHLDDPRRCTELAVEGVQLGQWCQRHFPAEPECRYRLALAVGQQARERPSTAADGLQVMVALLEELVDEAPEIDAAGPDRTLALVLLRAPGWPGGPGDPETGLEHARAAAAAFPQHPPNQLVLGEALLDNGLTEDGRRAFERGIELAGPLQAAGDRDAPEWAAEAREALAGIS